MHVFMCLKLFTLYLLFNTSSTGAVINLPENTSIPAVIFFGDSITDTGNNNYIPTLAKANFPPYGENFIGRNPTGRFSNGKIVPDFIAEELGIKPLSPPFLDPSLRDQDLLTGVNFASAGSGYDPLTSDLLWVLSLSDQLEMFKDYIDLYGLGARRIGVFSMLPIGCLPSQRTQKGGLGRKCVDEYNRIVQLFNDKLSAEITFLNTQFRDARIVYVDFYNLPLDIIRHPHKYGFKISSKGCCGTGTFEASILCRYACSNVDDYVFWDGFHPTEKTYQILARQVVEEYIHYFICGKAIC
ncbi:hypothetical protein MIMGU_mgv11b022350mg [Erythranthe guttata]|uniref:SGNH hydrolase-type esterase domain-containing protein n=1 Tax=Erythranthe guttata TaxID=4155 RepID=A0A022RG58_ERYGU|nr:hypothetical protein MIMGU_mgv11b022350mg [Erythranthe guttata]